MLLSLCTALGEKKEYMLTATDTAIPSQCSAELQRDTTRNTRKVSQKERSDLKAYPKKVAHAVNPVRLNNGPCQSSKER